MKKIKLDSILGILFNFILIIMFLISGGSRSVFLNLLPVIAVAIELFLVINNKIIEESTKWRYIVIGNKILLMVTPMIVLLYLIFAIGGSYAPIKELTGLPV